MLLFFGFSYLDAHLVKAGSLHGKAFMHSALSVYVGISKTS